MADYDADGIITTPGRLQGSRTAPGSVQGREEFREVIWHEPTLPTVTPARMGEREEHPAYGVLNFSRISTTPGAVLFDSDIRHREFVRLTVRTAERERGLGSDWIHGGREVIEVDMSLAQFAQAVSSFGDGSGTPITIRGTETNANIDGLVFSPRMAVSMAEVRGSAALAFADIEAAQAAVDALPKDAKTAERKAAASRLRTAIEHASGKVDFATKNLDRHVEKVVTRAKADIEAMVTRKAEALGLSAADVTGIAALEG